MPWGFGEVEKDETSEKLFVSLGKKWKKHVQCVVIVLCGKLTRYAVRVEAETSRQRSADLLPA